MLHYVNFWEFTTFSVDKMCRFSPACIYTLNMEFQLYLSKARKVGCTEKKQLEEHVAAN